MRLLTTAMIIFMAAGAAHAGMSISYEWGPTKKCFDSKSPPITLSGVPEGTVKLDIKMQDRNAMDFYHGGGRVDYTGQNALPYGGCPLQGAMPTIRQPPLSNYGQGARRKGKADCNRAG